MKKARTGHHWVEEILVRDKPRVCKRSFDFGEMAVSWQIACDEAPLGESISEPNNVGNRIYINKTEDSLSVVPVSPVQTYVDSWFVINYASIPKLAL